MGDCTECVAWSEDFLVSSKSVIVAVLTRAPSSGGKTRLFKTLGREPDPQLAEALLLDTLEAIARSGLKRVVYFTPPEAEKELRSLVPWDVPLICQQDGDLGDRMQAVFNDLFSQDIPGVLLLGSDLPLLSAGVLQEAEKLLCENPDVVLLGPATDGGYYLLGATRTPAALFQGVTWGVSTVLEETLARARTAKMAVRLMAETCDVDSPDDLMQVVRASHGGHRTRDWAVRHGITVDS